MDSYVYNGLRPLEIEMLRAESRGQKLIVPGGRNGKIGPPDVSHHLFNIRTGNEWLVHQSREPAPQKLFGEFWYQNELCIMFADTNVGKSILAVQIGQSIASGNHVGPFLMEAGRHTVLYVDFELSGKQFESRYFHHGQHFNFSDKFYRAEVNADFDQPNNTEHASLMIEKALEHGIKKTEAAVLIIDNLTCLRTGTEKMGEALSIMKHLKALKRKYNLSILVLAHTPKRNAANPLSRNDLQGSKMLMNFCDSAFAIGESATQAGVRYVKQIKQRHGRESFGADNVALFSIFQEFGFLQYQFLNYDREANHLRRRTQLEREQLAQRINDLHQQGRSQRQISRELGISLTRVNGMVTSPQSKERE